MALNIMTITLLLSWFLLTSHASLSPIRCGFAPCFINYKKDVLDSHPQVIKFASCLPMVGGSPASFTTKTGRHDIAESGNKHNESNQILFSSVEFLLLLYNLWSINFYFYYFSNFVFVLLLICKLLSFFLIRAIRLLSLRTIGPSDYWTDTGYNGT